MEQRPSSRTYSRPSSTVPGASSEREAFDVLEEMSRLLQTGLTRQELKACVNLLQQGNSHEALAKVVLDLRAEAAASRGSEK
ncbi:unnamed protein product [Jaminaea pallidilutea]